MRRWSVPPILLIPLVLLSGCERHIDVNGVRNLRVELKRPQNEYEIRLDILMRDADYKKFKHREVTLLTQACPSNECVIGTISTEVPVVHQMDGIDIVTFDMDSTNVPGDIPRILENIKTVRLNVGWLLGSRYQSGALTVH